jgi:hypothetical protein
VGGRCNLTRLIFLIAILVGVFIGGAESEEAFIGRWAIDPSGCTSEGDTAQTAPLYASATTVKWFVASCRIGKMYKTGAAVHIQAHCSSEGRERLTPITLEARGDRLRVIWDGTKVGEMRRCK